MSRAGVERPLEESALREIERSLHGKLKAHRLSEDFIARYFEDAVQKGFLDYLRARERGVTVDNRDAFVVHAAFRRALDELRHEAREADGAALEAVLEHGDLAAPPTEELAVEHLAACELHEAIGTLSPEARQVLALHYFEELSDRRGAEALYCSERTFRRRLAKALDALGRKLGASVPEPGSELALEVGLAAFVSLRGADVLLRRGRLAPIADALDWVRHALASLSGRLQAPAGRLSSSAAGERVADLAGTPAARIAGACAGAVAVCLLGGTVAGVFDAGTPSPQGRRGHDPGRVATQPERPEPRTTAEAAKPSAASGSEAQAGDGARRRSSGDSHKQSSKATAARRSRAEAKQVESQTSGIARAGGESAAPAEATEAVPPTSVSESTAPSAARPSTSSSEEEQAEQQFGAFK